MGRWWYSATQALDAMRRDVLIQAAAVGVMTVAFVLVGLAALSSLNVDRITSSWGRGVHVTVYLKSHIAPEQVERLRSVLQQRPEVAAVEAISPRQAHARVSRSLGARSGLLDDIEEGFFAPSLELRLRDATDPASSPLLGVIEALPGVDEVDHLGRWASRLGILAAVLRAGALLVALLMAGACLYVVASTIRLGVFARRQEIEIQRLVGATSAFIRAPFLIEGALQGLISATLALCMLYGIHRWLAPQLQAVFGNLAARVDLLFLAPLQLVVGIVAAMLLGVAGSNLALSRHAEP